MSSCITEAKLERKFHFRIASTSPIKGSVTLAVKREYQNDSVYYIVVLIHTVTNTKPNHKADVNQPTINYIADLFPDFSIYILSHASIMLVNTLNRSKQQNRNILLYEHLHKEWRICAKGSSLPEACMNIVYSDNELRDIVYNEYNNKSLPLEKVLELPQYKSGFKTKMKRSWKNFRKTLGFQTTKKKVIEPKSVGTEVIRKNVFELKLIEPKLIKPELIESK